MDRKLLAEAIPNLENALDTSGPWKPKPLSEIYKSNCMTPEELLRLYGSNQSCRVDGTTPFIEKQAESDNSPLPEKAEAWLKTTERRWLVLRCSSHEEADALCLRVLRCAHSCKATLCRPEELLKDCNEAPKYGPANKGSIIRHLSRQQVLGISCIGPEMPTDAVPYVADLLGERLQQMLPTIVAEDALSTEWRRRLVERGARSRDVERMFQMIYKGISM
ncbi:hypothetical protein ACTNC1_05200 [Atopobiaceae bacterium HCP3S3_A4]